MRLRSRDMKREWRRNWMIFPEILFVAFFILFENCCQLTRTHFLRDSCNFVTALYNFNDLLNQISLDSQLHFSFHRSCYPKSLMLHKEKFKTDRIDHFQRTSCWVEKNFRLEFLEFKLTSNFINLANLCENRCWFIESLYANLLNQLIDSHHRLPNTHSTCPSKLITCFNIYLCARIAKLLILTLSNIFEEFLAIYFIKFLLLQLLTL